MKYTSAITIALLGITSDLNVSKVNAVATKNKAQLEAKSSVTLKALSLSKTELKLKADA